MCEERLTTVILETVYNEMREQKETIEEGMEDIENTLDELGYELVDVVEDDEECEEDDEEEDD